MCPQEKVREVPGKLCLAFVSPSLLSLASPLHSSLLQSPFVHPGRGLGFSFSDSQVRKGRVAVRAS